MLYINIFYVNKLLPHDHALKYSEQLQVDAASTFTNNKLNLYTGLYFVNLNS